MPQSRTDAFAEAASPDPRVDEETHRALARPGAETLINRVVGFFLSKRTFRPVNEAQVRRFVNESLAGFQRAGARMDALASVRRLVENELRLPSQPAPAEVWCCEVRWPDGSDELPEMDIFADSAWGRLPTETAYAVAGQTAVDHMVSHLYRWTIRADYSELAACSDQVRLMWARRGLKSRVAAAVIWIGLVAHKELRPLSMLRQAKTPLPA